MSDMYEVRSEAAQRSAETRQRNLAAAEARAEALARTWCGAAHETWNKRAQCLMGRSYKIVGEGPIAVLHVGREVRLYGTQAEAAMDSPGLTIRVLQKGPHKKRRGL